MLDGFPQCVLDCIVDGIDVAFTEFGDAGHGMDAGAEKWILHSHVSDTCDARLIQKKRFDGTASTFQQ